MHGETCMPCVIRLTVDEHDDTRFEVDEPQSLTLDVVESMKVVDLPEYQGPYEVTPTLAAQSLATKGMAMKDDVTVDGIPSYRTTNVGGGYTVVIAQG